MSTPVIGITSYRDRAQSGVWDVEAVFLPWTYGHGVVEAGGAVAVLPPQPATADAVAAVLDRLDGLVIVGGADLDPAHYDAQPHPHEDEPRPERDAWELALAAGARERDLPYLGICRGAQLLNVSRGGTLIQHLPEVLGHKAHEGEDDRFGSVAVTTVAGTRVASLHPAESTVPVYHHQAIDTLGEGLTVAARSEFGVVEAVEDPSAAFCLGIQWHPEQDDRPELFEALVAAARAYRDARDVQSQQ